MAVVDSSALIHLVRTGRLNLLREFFKEVCITREIFEEVVKTEETKVGASQINSAVGNWIKILTPRQKSSIKQIAELEKIGLADASVILLAKERKDILLSNDYFLIKVANSIGVECWWLTTFILNCVRKKIIKKEEAKQILYNLVLNKMHITVDVYAAILREIDNL